MIKTCAICGRNIPSFCDVCKDCLKYKSEPWAIELIKIERHNNYINSIYSNYVAESLEDLIEREV